MQTHMLNCERCRKEFESKRSDAKYCSGTCRTYASEERNAKHSISKDKKGVKITLDYLPEELIMLQDRIGYSGLSPEDYIKRKSLSDAFSIKPDNDLIDGLEKEINLLKAELHHHRGENFPGVYLPIDETHSQNIRESLSKYMPREKYTLEEAIILASETFTSTIDEVIREVKEVIEAAKKR